jgi:thioredoxin-related protein
MKHLAAFFAFFLSLPASLHAGGEGWSSDFAAAKRMAAESKRDILIDFTGSDWCGWCIKLDEEVFQKQPFKDGTKNKFVLVEIDSPRDKTKLSEATVKQNEQLVKDYAVQGFPTILLCDAEGRPYAATGYEEGGPEKYVTHLDKLREQKAARDKAFAEADKLEGPAKAKALAAAIESMQLEPGLIRKFYGAAFDEIKKADPKDETGFVGKADLKEKISGVQQQLQEFAVKNDWEGAGKMLDSLISEKALAKEDKLRLVMTRALVFAQQGKFDEAKKTAKEAKEIAGEGPEAGQIDAFLQQIEQAAGAAPAVPQGN